MFLDYVSWLQFPILHFSSPPSRLFKSGLNAKFPFVIIDLGHQNRLALIKSLDELSVVRIKVGGSSDSLVVMSPIIIIVGQKLNPDCYQIDLQPLILPNEPIFNFVVASSHL